MARLSKSILALTCLLAFAGCRIEVYDQLSQRDANEMTALLLTAGVDAKRTRHKDGTFAVEVDEGSFAEAVMLIDQSGLPKPKFATMTDVLSDDRLIASPSEERARLNYAVSQELSRTVSEIEGVVSARVHLATPSDDPLSRNESKSSASVAIHHRRNFATAGIVPRIKVLVANAVDGLEYDSVSIALFPTVETSSTATVASEFDFEDPTPTGPKTVTPAGVGSFVMSPAIAAVLGGGFIVLLFAGQALLSGVGRAKKNVESDAVRDRRGR